MLQISWLRQVKPSSTGLKGKISAKYFSTTASNFNTTTDKPSSEFESRIQASLKKVETFKKRFWNEVRLGLEPTGFSVQLDGRRIKTPEGKVLLIPRSKPTLAYLVASEWDLQKKVVKPHTLPLTSLVSRSIDTFQVERPRNEAIQLLTKYLDTDTLCYLHSYPLKLNQRQQLQFQPILDWTKQKFQVVIPTTTSILGTKLNPEIKLKLMDAIFKLDPLALAGFERATIASKSFLIGLALMHNQVSVEEAAKLASLEIEYQLEHWGLVEDAHDVDFADLRRQLGSAALTNLQEQE